MENKRFIDYVADMRAAQKKYFKTRAHAALMESKRLESIVDAEIGRLKAIESGLVEHSSQLELF